MSTKRTTTARAVVWLAAIAVCGAAAAQPALPALDRPVNDFAGIVEAADEAAIERLSRALLEATGDAVVVATVETIAPYGDIREYAVKLFENHGRGIGQKGKDNGLLVLVAVGERRVWIEVGYDLEPFVTDGFAGETARRFMTPAFRQGRYGAGLQAGVDRLVQRIADGRGMTLDDVPRGGQRERLPVPVAVLYLMVLLMLISAARSSRRRRRRIWGRGPWSGWQSGVGTFGGWPGGGGLGGGFGGGFGGFGGGRSGGGGGGAGW